MPGKEIPDSAIELVAKHINTRSNNNYRIPVIGHEENIETPQIFEIIPFDQIDDSDRRFYAIDGSYNSEQFYNGLCIAIYAAGYICFHKGKQIRMNSLDDPVILGQAYYPENILITHPGHLNAIYDELLTLEPIKCLFKFLEDLPDKVFAYKREQICANLSTLLGRRIRYFVFDHQNDKLIGIVGLCDPVIGLGVRDDQSIGWTKNQKMQRLYNCMTAYILGAIPPYNKVLGSKLIALTLMFPTVRNDFYQKYKDSTSVITGENKKPYLVYIDTLGAFGKSAIYNRLVNWDFIDYTKGQSHLHITANGSWELIRQVVPNDVFNSYKFGEGPNWKMRILKRGLRELGLSEDMLSIGWQRGYYRCTLAENWQKYLLGDTNQVVWKDFTHRDLVSYWHEKWVTPRLDTLQTNLELELDL